MSETPEATAGNTGEAEPDTGLTVSKDTLEGAVAPSVPLRPTFTDASGVERIAGPPVSNWEPAPVEPSEQQIAAMDEHNAREAERRDARLGALTDSERLGDTAQPLVDANKAYADELGNAGDGVTDVTPPDPSATGDPTATGNPTVPDTTTSLTTPDPNVGSTTGTTVPPAAPSGDSTLETDAEAAADADVAAQVEAARAAQAQESATSADQALRDEETAEVAREEGQS